MLYLVPRIGDNTLMSTLVCIVLYLYTQWQILGRDYLLVIMLIEVDISRRVEDALLRKSGNCSWLLRCCCGPFL